jgi:hypothetical protein
MNTTPDVDFDALIAERATLKADIDAATARVKDIDQQIRDHHDYGTYEYAGLRVGIERNRRLDVARFRDAYPVDKHPELWKVTVDPDTAAVREHIAPADLDPFYNEGAPKVVVR